MRSGRVLVGGGVQVDVAADFFTQETHGMPKARLTLLRLGFRETVRPTPL